ncbi:hypothetical protein ACFLSH_00080 [Bacteroidota bacterium]
MKRLIISLVFVSIISLLLSATTFGAKLSNVDEQEKAGYNNYTILSDDEYHQVEQNLLTGIRSGNLGLQTSSAYFLGEMKSDKALIPLLRLVQNGETEEARIIAALSLYKIESKIGMYRLKYLAESDESELARQVFARIYQKYVVDKYSFRES